MEEVTARVPLVIVLMAMNFFLHGRYLMQRPANQMLIMAAGALDLAIVTAAVLTLQGGLQSQFFVFYYPVVLAFAFVFPPRLTVAYTVVTLAVYAGACLLHPSFPGDQASLKLLVNRLVTIAAMGGLGTYYWRIQRDRRREAMGASTSALGSVRAVRAGLRPNLGTATS